MVISRPDAASERIFGTFGIYRYILANMVVMAHIGPQEFAPIGTYAVFAFYILSGYVVSFILHYTYLPVPGGLRKYFVNRFLRIFPLYWIVMIGSLALLIAFPDQASQIATFYKIPVDIREWVWNITTIGLVDPLTGVTSQTRILIVAWSLGIEIIYWILIPRFLTDTRLQRRFICFSLGITLYGLLVCLYSHHYAPEVQFSNVLAASLPFCTGLLLFTRKSKNSFVIPHSAGIVSIITFGILVINAPYCYRGPYSLGFYSAFIINAILAGYLSQIDRNRLYSWVQKLDNFLGNLAYPIYLVHVPVGLAAHVIFPSLALHDIGIWGITTVSSSIIALILHHTIEIPIDSIRRRIKC